MKTVVRV